MQNIFNSLSLDSKESAQIIGGDGSASGNDGTPITIGPNGGCTRLLFESWSSICHGAGGHWME